MKKQFKLGVIGCSSMAQAVLRGVVLSDFLGGRKIIVNDRYDENIQKISDLGIRDVDNNKYIIENSEFLLLAVKENELNKVIETFEGAVPSKVISIIQGVKKNEIKNHFGTSAVKVARCVLNSACTIGSGIVGIDMSDYNSSVDDTSFISNVFNCLGTVLSVDESKLDAVACVGVDAAAHTLLFVDSLIELGISLGLTKNESRLLAGQVVMGVAELLQYSEKSIASLLKDVCDESGSAIEAIKALEDNKFNQVIGEAIKASLDKIKGKNQ